MTTFFRALALLALTILALTISFFAPTASAGTWTAVGCTQAKQGAAPTWTKLNQNQGSATGTTWEPLVGGCTPPPASPPPPSSSCTGSYSHLYGFPGGQEYNVQVSCIAGGFHVNIWYTNNFIQLWQGTGSYNNGSSNSHPYMPLSANLYIGSPSYAVCAPGSCYDMQDYTGGMQSVPISLQWDGAGTMLVFSGFDPWAYANWCPTGTTVTANGLCVTGTQVPAIIATQTTTMPTGQIVSGCSYGRNYHCWTHCPYYIYNGSTYRDTYGNPANIPAGTLLNAGVSCPAGSYILSYGGAAQSYNLCYGTLYFRYGFGGFVGPRYVQTYYPNMTCIQPNPGTAGTAVYYEAGIHHGTAAPNAYRLY